MATKTTKTATKSTKKPAAAKVSKTTSTSVRYSAVPKKTTAVKIEIGFEQIAERAYFISTASNAGTEMDNWLRAEKELRAAA